MFGGLGNDCILGGYAPGDNPLFSATKEATRSAWAPSTGAVTIVGGNDSADGADFLSGGTGADLMFGNGGNDTMKAAAVPIR